MARNCQFAFAVHALAMLASNPGRGVTSSEIAQSVNTNPVVIRRMLAMLRRAGLVQTRSGAAAGTRLSLPPRAIGLDAVYHAVEAGAPLSLPPHRPNRACPVGKKIETVLEEVFHSAQAALEKALSSRTLADVLGTIGRRAMPRKRRSARARQHKAV